MENSNCGVVVGIIATPVTWLKCLILILIICAAHVNVMAQTQPSRRVVNGCVIQDRTNCPNVNWQGENLNASQLNNAILSGSNLRGASFFKAGLSHTDLRNADLRGANLTRTNLVGADLRGANLEGAILKTTYLHGAIWVDGRKCAGDANATGGNSLAFESFFASGSVGGCR
jgi:uncharacterized protein YjbI with pentapeptide repeats